MTCFSPLHCIQKLLNSLCTSTLLFPHRTACKLLCLQLESELAVVPRLPSWQAAEPDSKYNLPSFSAYPQAYATAAGEYLMMLPQLLESLMASTGVEQEPSVDAHWLDKVACLDIGTVSFQRLLANPLIGLGIMEHAVV